MLELRRVKGRILIKHNKVRDTEMTKRKYKTISTQSGSLWITRDTYLNSAK